MNKGNLKRKQVKTEVKWRDSTCDSNDDKMVITHNSKYVDLHLCDASIPNCRILTISSDWNTFHIIVFMSSFANIEKNLNSSE